MDRVTLDGRLVRLEPLSDNHRDGLCAAIRDGELWKLDVTFVPHPDSIDRFLADAHAMAEEGTGLAFATIERQTGTVAGATRYMHASWPNRRIEIGFTFLGSAFQRTGINTEAKLLMLTHAFESLGMNRVEFVTDERNTASRQAILSLGAAEEGVLRSHMVMPDGRIRDSAIYSIVRPEWKSVQQRLEAMLGRRSGYTRHGESKEPGQ